METNCSHPVISGIVLERFPQLPTYAAFMLSHVQASSWKMASDLTWAGWNSKGEMLENGKTTKQPTLNYKI